MTIFDKIKSFTEKTYRAVGEVALFLGVSEKTVYRLLESGTLASVRIGDKGTHRILSESAAYIFVEHLWTASYENGHELKGVDPIMLESWARRLGIFGQ